jgi:hypothetical protein
MQPVIHRTSMWRHAVSPEAQRIAIAEACGWKLVTDNPEYEPYWEDPKGNMVAVSNGVHRFPDYLNDLNAMHEAEKVLTNQQKEKYLDILSDFTEGRRDTSYVWHDTVFATAAQRAEAFLKTLNLWKP